MRWFLPIFRLGSVPVAALSACTTFGAATSDTDAGADSSVDTTADANAADGGQKDSTVNAPDALSNEAGPMGCPGGKARVFVTSEAFLVTKLNVSGKSPQIVADEICQTAASNAALARTAWTAWLSTASSAAPTTMPASPAGYTDVKCQREIATVLGQGPLTGPINTTESGARLTDPLHTVWTGTKADGGIGATCTNWKPATSSDVATAGDTEHRTLWTDSGPVSCGSRGRFYCVEGARKTLL
jgi:hypothetical protein